MKKDLGEIRSLAGKKSYLIETIALSNEESFKHTALAKEISEFLSKNFSEVKVRFDLFGDHNSSYYNRIYFDVFSKNFSYPIARGGRYKINNLDSVGATIYMNRLRKF